MNAAAVRDFGTAVTCDFFRIERILKEKGGISAYVYDFPKGEVRSHPVMDFQNLEVSHTLKVGDEFSVYFRNAMTKDTTFYGRYRVTKPEDRKGHFQAEFLGPF